MTLTVPKVLILQMGTDSVALRRLHAENTDWLRVLLEPWGVQTSVAKAFDGSVLPALSGFDAVVATGSPANVTDRAPWMKAAADYLLKAEQAMPVLCICFGHQLMADALGAPVEPNPLGSEFGTCAVDLTAEGLGDPLFAGLPAQLRVQESHGQHARTVPPGTVLLAGNTHSAVQAYGRGDRLRCVQFHPEMPAQALRNYVAQGGKGTGSLPPQIEDTPHGLQILENWVRHFVQPHASRQGMKARAGLARTPPVSSNESALAVKNTETGAHV